MHSSWRCERLSHARRHLSATRVWDHCTARTGRPHDIGGKSLLEECHTSPLPSSIEARAISSIDLQGLAELDRARLRQLWRKYCQSPLPPKASRQFLIYCLAYRIQEQAYGGLSADSRTRLRNIAQQLQAAAGQPTGLRLAPGTRLIRQWREQRHEVTVLERGYAYRGKRYSSLSAIARLISGTHCSGPRFFGLKAAARLASRRR